MNDEFRQMVIEALKRGEDLPREWARELFPPEKREYELVYHGKEREEDIIANTMAVPLQPVSTFGKNGVPSGAEGWHNMLIFGDNLQVLKTLLEKKEKGELTNADGTSGVRLIYIDPPFATKKDFRGSQDQKAYQDKLAGSSFLEFLRRRLILLREIISDDGSIYVHLDWKKSHYVKTLMDEIFGETNFLNEVIWYYRRWNIATNLYARNHDSILFYAKNGSKHIFNNLYVPKSEKSSAQGQAWKSVIDENGVRRSILTGEETKGVPMPDVWELSIINPIGNERVEIGYPTQKPESLLDRIIQASSNPDDLVLDAFAGSGTTCAVAEKLGRRWIGIDCGKLAIYTIQKRMLNLKSEIGNKGKPLAPKPFTLYNAGLYDFSTLRELDRDGWKRITLQLFGANEDAHKIGGLQLDGKLKGASVLVFNHHQYPEQRIDETTIQDIHTAVGKKVGRKFFIIAPRAVFDFQQDYIDMEGVRYYALRIPYSVINELHARRFSALRQPVDETDVNDIVDAWGFDFIQPPTVAWDIRIKKRKGQLLEEACLKIKKFESRARIRGQEKLGGFDTFAMLMLDMDFDDKVFAFDRVFYAQQLAADDWQAWFPLEDIGAKMMAVFLDLYGNEARQIITRAELGLGANGERSVKKKVRP